MQSVEADICKSDFRRKKKKKQSEQMDDSFS